MASFACGVLFGFVIAHFSNRVKALWRHCCREHYATHSYCLCSDCRMEREAR